MAASQLLIFHSNLFFPPLFLSKRQQNNNANESTV